MYTPLVKLAFKLNHLVTRKVWHWKMPFSWNVDEKMFELEDPSFSNLGLWYILNTGTLLGCIFPACIYSLLDALHHPENYNFFQVICLFFQLLVCTVIFGTFYTVHQFSAEIVYSMNEMQKLEHNIQLERLVFRVRNRESTSKTKGFKQKLYITIKTFLYVNGAIDYIGLITLDLVLSFFLITLFAPAMLGLSIYANVKLDVVYFVLEAVFPSSIRSKLLSFFLSCVRLLALSFFALVGFSLLQIMPAIGLVCFDATKNLIVLVSREYPNFMFWRAMRIAFIHSNIYSSQLLIIVLPSMFLLEIVCVVIAVYGVGDAPWYVYAFFPLNGFFGMMVIILFFYAMVFCYSESVRTEQHWTWKCALSMKKVEERFQARMVYKNIRTMQPIAFTCGDIGIITDGTRSDYFYSILENSVNAILAVR